MNIYTDNARFAGKFVGENVEWEAVQIEAMPPSVRPFFDALVQADTILYAGGSSSDTGQHLLLIDSAEESQFDVLNRVVHTHAHPTEGLLCVAGVGKNFHGFKNRSWETARGNLHLSALVSPFSTVRHAGVAFTVLAVVSVLQTLDELGALPERASVKWVNDLMIGSAKIGGVLASAQVQGDLVTHATLGIGLNIEKTPHITPTPFVPTVGSLHQFSIDPARCSLRLVFERLIMYLGANYRSLLAGGYAELLELYRSRSLVIGKRVRLHRDTSDAMPGELLQGIVTSIGDDLELFIDQSPSPVFTGRLELLSD